jgi:SAM-dependent methyltransferase
VADDILNLGAGNKILAGALNHDRTVHRPEIDVAWDLNVLPWPWPDESFDQVIAVAVLEHLQIDLLASVGEIWRLLRPGGQLYMKLPYWRHENTYTDPTHYWRFSLDTARVFDPDTEYGKRYRFYTNRKWRIVKGPKLNNARSSIHVTMVVRK